MELTNEFEVAVPVEQAWAVLTDVERIAPCLPGAQLQEVEGDEYRGLVKVKVGPITASYKGVARFESLDADEHRAVLRAEGRDTRGQGNANAVITATLVGTGDSTTVSVVTDLNITGKVAQFGRGVLADVSAKLLDQFVQSLEQTVLTQDDSGDGDGGDGGESGPEGADSQGAGSESTDSESTDADVGEAEDESSATERVNDSASDAVESESDDSQDQQVHDALPPSGPRQINSEPAEPVDLVGIAGGTVVGRLAPILSAAGSLAVIIIVFRIIRRRRS